MIEIEGRNDSRLIYDQFMPRKFDIDLSKAGFGFIKDHRKEAAILLSSASLMATGDSNGIGCAVGLGLFFTAVGVIAYAVDRSQDRKNMQIRVENFNNGQKLLDPDNNSIAGKIAKKDEKILRKRYPDADPEQITLAVGTINRKKPPLADL